MQFLLDNKKLLQDWSWYNVNFFTCTVLRIVSNFESDTLGVLLFVGTNFRKFHDFCKTYRPKTKNYSSNI